MSMDKRWQLARSEHRVRVAAHPHLPHPEGRIDWRTMNPEMLKDSVVAEELRTYAEHLAELLEGAEGGFVLIVGREIINVFETLDDAALAAHQQFPGRPVLIKKVAASEPVHTPVGVAPTLEDAKG